MEGKRSRTKLQDLPEECIAKILSFTTPVDACKLSLVSKDFRSAAEYDIVWDRFVPSDLSSIIPPSSIPSSNSKKSLFFTLSDRPTFIDQGTKSFQLDKRTGNKSYMFSATDLSIWPDSDWTSLPESRFQDVARLRPASLFSIYRMIKTSILSPNTQYAAFLVFKSMEASTSSVWFFGGIGSAESREQRPNERRDGWLEIEIGNFNSGLKEDQVPIKLKSIIEVSDIWAPGGFILEGIEVRPY